MKYESLVPCRTGMHLCFKSTYLCIKLGGSSSGAWCQEVSIWKLLMNELVLLDLNRFNVRRVKLLRRHISPVETGFSGESLAWEL